MKQGWVKLHREQFSHWISKKPYCDGYAWSYLYAMANHKKGIVNFRNEYIEVERGQVLTSKLNLMKEFKWTKRHLNNFLTALEKDGNVTYRTTNRFTLITIVKYDVYQGDGYESDQQNDQQVSNRCPTGVQQVSTNKNDNNVKNEKNEKEEDIYTHWNNQKIVVHKKNNYRSQIRSSLKKYSHEEVLTAITNYAIIVNDDDYYFDYKWTLGDFLKRGIGKFTDLEIAKNNYRVRKPIDTDKKEVKYINLK